MLVLDWEGAGWYEGGAFNIRRALCAENYFYGQYEEKEVVATGGFEPPTPAL